MSQTVDPPDGPGDTGTSDGPIGRITLNRPDVYNAINVELAQAAQRSRAPSARL